MVLGNSHLWNWNVWPIFRFHCLQMTMKWTSVALRVFTLLFLEEVIILFHSWCCWILTWMTIRQPYGSFVLFSAFCESLFALPEMFVFIYLFPNFILITLNTFFFEFFIEPPQPRLLRNSFAKNDTPCDGNEQEGILIWGPPSWRRDARRNVFVRSLLIKLW